MKHITILITTLSIIQISLTAVAPNGTGTSEKETIAAGKPPRNEQAINDNQFVEDATGDKKKSQELEMPLGAASTISLENVIGALEKLQEVQVEMKKLTNLLEKPPLGPMLKQLTALSNSGLPKTWDSVSKLLAGSQSTITGNVGEPTDIANTDADSDTSLPSCRINDANFNECLKSHLQEGIKYSKQGIPEFSIPPLDPYSIPQSLIPKMQFGGLKIELKSARVLGFSEAKVLQVKGDPRDGLFNIQLSMPEIKCQGQYAAAGKISETSNLQINGKGDFDVSFIETSAAVKIEGLINNRDGHANKFYLDVYSVTIRLKPQKMNLRFENLFGANKELSDAVNLMMNENWRNIFFIIQPTMEKEMSKYLLKILKTVFKGVPYEEIFPDF